MANTITLLEPDIADVLIGYVGIQLERGTAQAGPWTVIAQLPYVAGQASYVYEDAAGTTTSWYRSARYSASGSLGPHSSAWPVSPPLTSGVTLAELERETARKVGPFYELAMDQQRPTVGLFDRAMFPGLRSTIEQDLVTNLWLLRRGLDVDGNLVPVSLEDRQRTVAEYDPGAGEVIVDRPWSAAPAPGEIVEFHHLNPALELRRAVLAGLRRCFFEDRLQLAPGYIYETDLTQMVPWLDSPRDVLGVQVAPYPSNGWGGGPMSIPFTAFGQGGHVCLRLNTGWNGPYFGGILVTVARSYFTLVNGLLTTTGPINDTDQLEVDVDYAASASHIEAWHNFPARLQAAAAGNLQASQKDAAAEFTRQAKIHGPRRPDLFRMQTLYPSVSGLTVVNA